MPSGVPLPDGALSPHVWSLPYDAMTSQKHLVACALAAAACVACGTPDDSVTGTVIASTPLTTPISEQPACIVQLRGEVVRVIGTQARTSYGASRPRIAEGARFIVDGRELGLTGQASSAGGLEQGETWVSGTMPAPARLAEYGFDGRSAVMCYGTEAPPSTCSNVRSHRLTERFVRCGAAVSLQGHVDGDRFVLHDHTAEEAGTALGMLGASALCLVCPIVAVVALIVVGIVVVWRRRARS